MVSESRSSGRGSANYGFASVFNNKNGVLSNNIYEHEGFAVMRPRNGLVCTLLVCFLTGGKFGKKFVAIV